jgi:hypothetical protein
MGANTGASIVWRLRYASEFCIIRDYTVMCGGSSNLPLGSSPLRYGHTPKIHLEFSGMTMHISGAFERLNCGICRFYRVPEGD